MLFGCSRLIVQRCGSRNANRVIQRLADYIVLRVEGRLQKSLNEKKEYQDLLITCITLHLDFFEERSGRSCTICKCPMQKLSTEVERPSIFESTIQWICKLLRSWCMMGNNLQAVTLTTLFHRRKQSYQGTPQGVKSFSH
ncbi:hypothetical protein P3S67_008781 [Capsicum chacoense]